MGWIIFFTSSVVVFLLAKPFRRWSQIWYAGIITLAALYAIDSTLIRLGAFSYQYPNTLLGGMPIFYWLSSFFGGMVLVYYFPKRNVWQFPYILLSAFLFLLLELIMHFLGYFNYHSWTPVNSFFLNVTGFTVVLWLWNWIRGIIA